MQAAGLQGPWSLDCAASPAPTPAPALRPFATGPSPDHNVHAYVVAWPGSGDEGARAEAVARPRLCAVGEPGELVLSGPRLALGEHLGRWGAYIPL